MQKFLYLILISAIWIACSKDVRISIPPGKILPVLTSLISSDSTVWVDLSYSKPVLDTAKNYASIRNAQVRLYVNNAFTEILTPKELGPNFQYTSVCRPKQGENIRLEASLNDQILTGETVVPLKPQFGAGTGLQETKDAFGNTEYRIQFSINDTPTAHDYYRLRLYEVRNGVTQYNNPIPFYLENIKTLTGGIFDDFSTPDQSIVQYFDDQSFNGKNFLVRMKSLYGSPLDKIAIELSAISKEAYLYFTTIQLQELRNDDPLYEKVSIYSNIKNGLGLLGSLNKAVLIQEVKK